MSKVTDLICKIIPCPPLVPAGAIVPPPAGMDDVIAEHPLSSREMLHRYTTLVEQSSEPLDSRELALLSNLVHAQFLLETENKQAALILSQQVQQRTNAKDANSLLATTYLGQAAIYTLAGDDARAELAQQMAAVYQQE